MCQPSQLNSIIKETLFKLIHSNMSSDWSLHSKMNQHVGKLNFLCVIMHLEKKHSAAFTVGRSEIMPNIYKRLELTLVNCHPNCFWKNMLIKSQSNCVNEELKVAKT